MTENQPTNITQDRYQIRQEAEDALIQMYTIAIEGVATALETITSMGRALKMEIDNSPLTLMHNTLQAELDKLQLAVKERRNL